MKEIENNEGVEEKYMLAVNIKETLYDVAKSLFNAYNAPVCVVLTSLAGLVRVLVDQISEATKTPKEKVMEAFINGLKIAIEDEEENQDPCSEEEE